MYDGERQESLTTTKTPLERNDRGESRSKDNEPTPRTIGAFEEKPGKEDKKTLIINYELEN